MFQSRLWRSFSLFLAFLLFTTALYGCVPSQEQQRKNVVPQYAPEEQEPSPEARSIAQVETTESESYRDIMGELAEGGVSQSSSPPPSPSLSASPSPSSTPEPSPADDEGAETEAANPSPAAESPSPSPTPTTETASAAKAYLPFGDGLYFGMSRSELQKQVEADPVEGNDPAGDYLVYENVIIFAGQEQPGTAQFYFDEKGKLVLLKYQYCLGGTAEAPLSREELEQNQSWWNERFQGVLIPVYYAGDGKPLASGGLYDAVSDQGSAQLNWFGEEIEVSTSVFVPVDSPCVEALFCFQKAGDGLINMNAPKVEGSWTDETLTAYYAQNELAADHHCRGQYIQLAAKIAELYRDDSGQPCVVVETEGSRHRLVAAFSERELEILLTYKIGDIIYFEGYVGNVIRNGEAPILHIHDCMVISWESYQAQETYLRAAE